MGNKTVKCIVIAAVLLLVVLVNVKMSLASEVILKDGSKIEGTIVKMNTKSVSIKTSLGLLTISRDKIATINLVDVQNTPSTTVPKPVTTPAPAEAKPAPPNKVTDIDGNVYHTVRIGTQVWMVENLKTTKYRDGTSIPNITDNTAWSNLTTGAYCDYNNGPSNSATYGRLYNWYAATDARGICPTGWHVPSDAEWTTLVNYFGGDSVAGGKLKEAGTTHWASPNTGATNESGFTAFPGGYRQSNGSFDDIGIVGYWWSATGTDAATAWYRFMGCGNSDVGRNNYGKTGGFSVRCVRD